MTRLSFSRKSFLALLVPAALLLAARPPRRQIAVTFDDLPGVSVAGEGVAAARGMTERLLTGIKAAAVPAVGFVNEAKLASNGERDPARVALLEMWTGAGLELGNHTYSHPDLHRTALPTFREDVVLGEPVTRSLLEKRGGRMRYFRHPFLHTGRDLETKKAFEEFLARRGYRVAPVTVDNSEWIFARAYVNALARRDVRAAGRIAGAYAPYMERKVAYYERQSVALFAREIPQVLLLHANSLNADRFGALAAMLQKRGYSFVSLEEALRDPAYTSADTYTGPAGLSWLHRWALSGAGRVLPDEPRAPDFILAEAGIPGE